MTQRRLFLSSLLGATFAAKAQDYPRRVPPYEAPLFHLHKQISSPVKISRVEVLEHAKSTFVMVHSSDGATGIVRTKEIDDFMPILLHKVIPGFVGRDARDLESIIDDVYITNYKWAGQPFWSPVAAVEQATWDLLGRVAKKPVAELMGGMLRAEIPVYLSGSGRETTAEEEVEVYVRGLAETQAKAVKFKIGGRMGRNVDHYPGRTRKMLELARKRMGDDITIYVDANGGYDSASAIDTTKWMAGLKIAFFEEPCPWEEVSETKRVADAIQMPVAGGECDSSLWKFADMIERRVIDIVQPDLNYCGGIIRAARIARMAAKARIPITPHNTQIDSAGVKMLAFAAAIPNIGPFMEFPHRAIPKPASWYTPNLRIQNGKLPVPKGVGLGVEFDPAYLKQARRLES
jgi:L-alanine-DL-glutamate epimerase-like enolase superfamily enzyme